MENVPPFPCDNCEKLKLDVNDKRKNFDNLKQKIIVTDRIIETYKVKCHENEIQAKKLEEYACMVGRLQRDCSKLENDLSVLLNQSVNKEKELTEDVVQKLKLKLETSKEQLSAAQSMLRQYASKVSEIEHNNVTLKRENVATKKELTDLERSSNKKIESVESERRRSVKTARLKHQRLLRDFILFGKCLDSKGLLKGKNRVLFNGYVEQQQVVVSVSDDDEGDGDETELESDDEESNARRLEELLDVSSPDPFQDLEDHAARTARYCDASTSPRANWECEEPLPPTPPPAARLRNVRDAGCGPGAGHLDQGELLDQLLELHFGELLALSPCPPSPPWHDPIQEDLPLSEDDVNVEGVMVAKSNENENDVEPSAAGAMESIGSEHTGDPTQEHLVEHLIVGGRTEPCRDEIIVETVTTRLEGELVLTSQDESAVETLPNLINDKRDAGKTSLETTTNHLKNEPVKVISETNREVTFVETVPTHLALVKEANVHDVTKDVTVAGTSTSEQADQQSISMETGFEIDQPATLAVPTTGDHPSTIDLCMTIREYSSDGKFAVAAASSALVDLDHCYSSSAASDSDPDTGLSIDLAAVNRHLEEAIVVQPNVSAVIDRHVKKSVPENAIVTSSSSVTCERPHHLDIVTTLVNGRSVSLESPLACAAMEVAASVFDSVEDKIEPEMINRIDRKEASLMGSMCTVSEDGDCMKREDCVKPSPVTELLPLASSLTEYVSGNNLDLQIAPEISYELPEERLSSSVGSPVKEHAGSVEPIAEPARGIANREGCPDVTVVRDSRALQMLNEVVSCTASEGTSESSLTGLLTVSERPDAIDTPLDDHDVLVVAKQLFNVEMELSSSISSATIETAVESSRSGRKLQKLTETFMALPICSSKSAIENSTIRNSNLSALGIAPLRIGNSSALPTPPPVHVASISRMGRTPALPPAVHPRVSFLKSGSMAMRRVRMPQPLCRTKVRYLTNGRLRCWPDRLLSRDTLVLGRRHVKQLLASLELTSSTIGQTVVMPGNNVGLVSPLESEVDRCPKLVVSPVSSSSEVVVTMSRRPFSSRCDFLPSPATNGVAILQQSSKSSHLPTQDSPLRTCMPISDEVTLSGTDNPLSSQDNTMDECNLDSPARVGNVLTTKTVRKKGNRVRRNGSKHRLQPITASEMQVEITRLNLIFGSTILTRCYRQPISPLRPERVPVPSQPDGGPVQGRTNVTASPLRLDGVPASPVEALKKPYEDCTSKPETPRPAARTDAVVDKLVQLPHHIVETTSLVADLARPTVRPRDSDVQKSKSKRRRNNDELPTRHYPTRTKAKLAVVTVDHGTGDIAKGKDIVNRRVSSPKQLVAASCEIQSSDPPKRKYPLRVTRCVVVLNSAEVSGLSVSRKRKLVAGDNVGSATQHPRRKSGRGAAGAPSADQAVVSVAELPVSDGIAGPADCGSVKASVTSKADFTSQLPTPVNFYVKRELRGRKLPEDVECHFVDNIAEHLKSLPAKGHTEVWKSFVQGLLSSFSEKHIVIFCGRMVTWLCQCATSKTEVDLGEEEAKCLRVVGLLLERGNVDSLDQELCCCIVETIMEERLEMLGKVALCRFYVRMCKERLGVERARIFVYDVMKCCFSQSGHLLFHILSIWPDIMNGCHNADDPTYALIAYIVTEKHSLIGFKSRPDLLKVWNIMGCVGTHLNRERLTEMLLNNFKCGSDDVMLGARKSLELLTEVEGWLWTSANIVGKHLWPIFKSLQDGTKIFSDACMANGILLFGSVLRHKSGPQSNTTKMLLTSMLNVLAREDPLMEPVAPSIQDALVQAILILLPPGEDHPVRSSLHSLLLAGNRRLSNFTKCLLKSCNLGQSSSDATLGNS